MCVSCLAPGTSKCSTVSLRIKAFHPLAAWKKVENSVFLYFKGVEQRGGGTSFLDCPGLGAKGALSFL